MYGKVFTSIFTGSLYGKFEATVTLVACVVLSDRDGHLNFTPQALAGATGFPIEVIRKGLEDLQQPDANSRSAEHGGRRIIRIDPNSENGFIVVNKAKYRSFVDPETEREQTRERVRRHRAKHSAVDLSGGCSYCGGAASGPDHIVPQSQGGTECVPSCARCNQRKGARTLADFLNDPFCSFIDHQIVRKNNVLMGYVLFDGNNYKQVVTTGNRSKRHTDTNPDADTKTKDMVSCADRWADFWRAYPKKVKKKSAHKIWKSRKLDRIADTILEDIRTRLAEDARWRKDGGQYIPDPTTYLNQDRWEDEITAPQHRKRA